MEEEKMEEEKMEEEKMEEEKMEEEQRRMGNGRTLARENEREKLKVNIHLALTNAVAMPARGYNTSYLLRLVISSGAHQNTVDLVQSCHYQLAELLNSLAEESQPSRQPGSPYPDDLANAPIGSPPFPEGGIGSDDAMMVDGDCGTWRPYGQRGGQYRL
ncbi:hypothetical protein EDB83DRAFT_2309815 [Lactarius deliciosus]|nr:hypothetical protein EDB83DRAFT_2309815 [Lactarius deliciosus]